MMAVSLKKRVRLSRALSVQMYLAELLTGRSWEGCDDTTVLPVRGFWAKYAVANLWPGRSFTAFFGR